MLLLHRLMLLLQHRLFASCLYMILCYNHSLLVVSGSLLVVPGRLLVVHPLLHLEFPLLVWFFLSPVAIVVDFTKDASLFFFNGTHFAVECFQYLIRITLFLFIFFLHLMFRGYKLLNHTLLLIELLRSCYTPFQLLAIFVMPCR